MKMPGGENFLRLLSLVNDNRLHTVRLNPAREDVAKLQGQLDAAAADPRVAFACIQSLDKAAPDVQRLVFAWLDRVVGRVDATSR